MLLVTEWNQIPTTENIWRIFFGEDTIMGGVSYSTCQTQSSLAEIQPYTVINWL